MSVYFTEINQNIKVNNPCEKMNFLNRVRSQNFKQPHLLRLNSIDVISMQLGIFHSLNIFNDLQLLS